MEWGGGGADGVVFLLILSKIIAPNMEGPGFEPRLQCT